MWLVGELGLHHRRLDYGHIHGGTDDADFLAMNPNGLVPAISDDQTTMFESCAINRYLAARYGCGGPYWADDPVKRAKADMWAEWAKTTLCPAFTAPVFWRRVRTPAQDRDEPALSAAITEFERRLLILSAQIDDQDYITGPELTLADIVAGHLLFRYYDIDIPRADLPVIRAYYNRLTQRPAYRTHVMTSYEPLRVSGAD